MGVDLARAAWPGLKQAFSWSPKDATQLLPYRPTTKEHGPVKRVTTKILRQLPVGLLLINCGISQPETITR
jgi:hypothetical protein